MTIHVNTVRSAVNSILEGSTEGDLETAKVKKTIETYGSKMPKEKLALYKSLLQLKESKRMKSLKALHWLSNEPEEPKELRSKVFGATKQKKIAWHRMSYWLFALTVKQLRQVAAVVRGEVPAEVRNGRKVQIVFYIVKGAVEGADRPAKLGEVYANTLEVSQWDGLPDKESVEYQKAHDQKKAKAKKRRRKRREKKQPSKKKSKKQKPRQPKASQDASSELDDALNTIREIAEGTGADEGRMREIAREELRSDDSKEFIHEVVDQRVEEKMDEVNLNLSFA